MDFSKRIMAIVIAVCSMAGTHGVAVGLEGTGTVEVTFTGEQPMNEWDPYRPEALLMLHNGTDKKIHSIKIDGRVIACAAAPGVSTAIKLHFDGVSATVCRVQASGTQKGKGAKFIAVPGYTYFCTLIHGNDESGDQDHDGVPRPEGPIPPAPVIPGGMDAKPIEDGLDLNRNLFNAEKAQFDELQRLFEEVDNERKWLDGSINKMKLEHSHLIQEKTSLLALRDNLATLQQPGITSELATVRTAIDTRLQALTKDLQAKELAMAPFQPRLDNANIRASELEEELKTSRSALDALDKKFRSRRRSQTSQQ